MKVSSGFQWKQNPGVWITKGWKAFNHWRKKYWLTRTLILLALFFPPLYELVVHPRLMQKLVRIACDAILASSEPQLTDSTAKYYVRREIKTLQTLMLAKIDVNRNGIIDDNELHTTVEMGINPDILQAQVVDVKLDEIVADARKMDMGLPIRSAVRIRKEAWFAAVGETQAIFDNQSRQINSYLYYGAEFPKYRKWKTWKRAFVNFYDYLQLSLAQLTNVISKWMPWFLLVFLFSLSIQGFSKSNRSRLKALFALIPAIVFTLIIHIQENFSIYGTLIAFAFMSISYIIGNIAVWFGKKYRFDYEIRLGLLNITISLTIVLPLLGSNPILFSYKSSYRGFTGIASFFHIYRTHYIALINSIFILLFIAWSFLLTYALCRIKTNRSEKLL